MKDIEQIRIELWCNSVLAYERSDTGIYTESAIKRADEYLKAFDERFKNKRNEKT